MTGPIVSVMFVEEVLISCLRRVFVISCYTRIASLVIDVTLFYLKRKEEIFDDKRL